MTSGSGTVTTYQNYINGEWVGASNGAVFEQRNPACLSEVTGLFPDSPAEDAQKAIDTATAAFPAWRATPAPARAAILSEALANMKARKEELAVVLTRENGKTLQESYAEIDAAIREMTFQIAEGERLIGETLPSSTPGVLAYTVYEPLGVVAAICPWNFPFNVAGRKCVPALMAGNTCILKPASLTPQTGLRFTELFADAGLPPGVLNCIIGSGKRVGDTLVCDPRIKAISFTGSTAVGMAINQKAAATLTRTQLEMGGKNPAVVLADADLELAVDAVVLAAYACAGQWCTSTSRAIVEESIAEAFTERLLEKVKTIKVGNGLADNSKMGPVCGAVQRDTVLDYIEQGKKEGAHLLIGGKRIMGTDHADGCFIEPTVFGGVLPNMTIAQEEIFGPVLSILKARDFDDAVNIANDVKYGLSSSVFTRDIKKAFTFLDKTEAGLAHVNMMSAYKEPQLPLGGVKDSGHGIPEAGHTGIKFFSHHKTVYIKA